MIRGKLGLPYAARGNHAQSSDRSCARPLSIPPGVRKPPPTLSYGVRTCIRPRISLASGTNYPPSLRIEFACRSDGSDGTASPCYNKLAGRFERSPCQFMVELANCRSQTAHLKQTPMIAGTDLSPLAETASRPAPERLVSGRTRPAKRGGGRRSFADCTGSQGHQSGLFGSAWSRSGRQVRVREQWADLSGVTHRTILGGHSALP